MMAKGTRHIVKGTTLKYRADEYGNYRVSRWLQMWRKPAKHIFAVGSGKGGTAKTSTVAYTALALSDKGYNVGLLDADHGGANLAYTLGVSNPGKRLLSEATTPLKVPNHNIWVYSVAEFFPADTALEFTLRDTFEYLFQAIMYTKWPKDLDFLIVDLPPGTDGPIQALKVILGKYLKGMVLVSGAQALSQLDCRKMANLCDFNRIPIIGVIGTMQDVECHNVLECPMCGTEIECGNHIQLWAGDINDLVAFSHSKLIISIPFIPALNRFTDKGELPVDEPKIMKYYETIAEDVIAFFKAKAWW